MKTKKHLTIQQFELPVEVEKQKNGGYLARCPVWSDCYAQGETLEEALNEISYVASSLIELYKEEDLKIPLKLKKEEKIKSSTINFNLPLVVST